MICFNSLYLEYVTSKYSERLYLCIKSYHCEVNSKFSQLYFQLNVIECTLGCQYIHVALSLLQTHASKEPLFKCQDPVNLTPFCYFVNVRWYPKKSWDMFDSHFLNPTSTSNLYLLVNIFRNTSNRQILSYLYKDAYWRISGSKWDALCLKNL